MLYYKTRRFVVIDFFKSEDVMPQQGLIYNQLASVGYTKRKQETFNTGSNRM